MTTLHANSPAESIARLTTMVRYGSELPVDVIEANIASAIHLVVQTQRGLDGMRRICEVVSFSFNREAGRCETQPVYQREIDADSGQWVSFPSWIDELSRWGVANGEEVESWKRTCCLS